MNSHTVDLLARGLNMPALDTPAVAVTGHYALNAPMVMVRLAIVPPYTK
jgi:hypothetical protein